MRSDPIERIIEIGLDEGGIPHVGEEDPRALNLDFYLPDFDVHIEVKQFHTPRISEQMSRASNVIAIQGQTAAKLLADIMARSKDSPPINNHP